MSENLIPSGHPIFPACAGGNVSELRRFLDEGMYVYSKSGAEPPLITIACGHCRKECVDSLVEFGLDINEPFNRFGQPPLQQAISYGHEVLVKHLIEIGADVNQEDNLGCVPLRGLFGSGKIDLAKLLISKGAHVESKKSDFVQAAAQGNQIESLEFISKKFCLESNALDSVDERMGTPLIAAASISGNRERIPYHAIRNACREDKQHPPLSPAPHSPSHARKANPPTEPSRLTRLTLSPRRSPGIRRESAGNPPGGEPGNGQGRSARKWACLSPHHSVGSA